MNNQVVNGWSVREVLGVRNDHFEVEVGTFVISAKNRSAVRGRPSIVIDLINPARTSQRIYQADPAARIVSKAEYDKL